jgi:hypothetical protein
MMDLAQTIRFEIPKVPASHSLQNRCQTDRKDYHDGFA